MKLNNYNEARQYALKRLPMWEYLCPHCSQTIDEKQLNSGLCPHCGYQFTESKEKLRIPPRWGKDKKAFEDAVHKYVFPTLKPDEREALAEYFTVIFSDGFESGDFTAWDSTASNEGGQPTVQSSVKHTGSYAMSCALTQGGYYARAFKSVSSGSTFYVRAYVQVNRLPESGETYESIIMMCLASSGLGGVEIKIIESGGAAYFQARNNYYGSTDNGSQVAVNTWYCVETKNLASGSQEWWVDGVSQGTEVGTGAVSMDILRVGMYHYGGSSSATLYIDCVVVADAYIGPESAEEEEAPSPQPFFDSSTRGGKLRSRAVFKNTFQLD